jgi:hypothetical protein
MEEKPAHGMRQNMITNPTTCFTANGRQLVAHYEITRRSLVFHDNETSAYGTRHPMQVGFMNDLKKKFKTTGTEPVMGWRRDSW